MSSQDIKPRAEHDWLCTSEHYGNVIEARYCQQCRLIERVREDERERLTNPPEDTWTCGDCGNTYDPAVRYCPNSMQDLHSVMLAPRKGSTSND